MDFNGINFPDGILTEWNEEEEDAEDKQQWEDDWDDEDVDDAFSKQLR
jgi:26 proteasome complex subunit DSS1